YNGMEKDDDVKGIGNNYTTEFRQYDPRVGRWLSLDPLASTFVWQSPYVAYDDNPININDPYGLGGGDPIIKYAKNIKKDVVTKGAEKVLTDLAAKTGLNSLLITSTARTPEKQASIMYTQLIEGRPQNYKKPGKLVQQVYYDMKDSHTREEILTAMTAKIYELGPAHVSLHIADPKDFITVDISLGSVPIENKADFISNVEELKKNGVVADFQHPGNNPKEQAYHIALNTKKLNETTKSSNAPKPILAKQNIFSTQLNSELKSLLVSPKDVIQNNLQRIDLIYPESKKVDFNWRIYLMFRGAPEKSIKR
ncbi:RHS repeat domain-containing protein, partial [Flavobacterium sp. RHBU_24]|uniref:RHS repeat domain-containing protein n=1 Tax=Flavobacterium sp. RHBU_24 TaxID=3391185 RepID=UPI0039849CBF